MRIKKRNKGFGLLEIMIAVAILGIIVVIGSNSFFSILRGSTKTKNLQLVKQNGDYALSVMERMIRNARMIIEPSSDGTTNFITILNPDGGQTTFSCEGNEEDKKITSNSASLISNETKITSSCDGFFNIISGKPGLKPATVEINFTLGLTGTTSLPHERIEIPFKTAVTLRNY